MDIIVSFINANIVDIVCTLAVLAFYSMRNCPYVTYSVTDEYWNSHERQPDDAVVGVIEEF